MGKIAIMVDAGYLFAASSELLAGAHLKRHRMALAVDEVVLALLGAASMAEPADELLRIYWYDASASPDRLTDDQREIALKRDCKLRLGSINSYGAQKGVDTLIVMDMLALARNKAVSSLLVVTGDEDLKLAIEAAQEQGVRVHLLGIVPPPGAHNQSERLRRECDSQREWTKADVAEFMSLVPPGDGAAADRTASLSAAADAAPNGAANGARTPALKSDDEALADAIEHAIASATDEDLRTVLQFSTDETVSIPNPLDRRLLGRYGGHLDRTVTEDEKRVMRRRFHERVAALLGSVRPGSSQPTR